MTPNDKISHVMAFPCSPCRKFLTNSQNTLDILAVLWENIVLEIPISYTICDELELPSERVGWDMAHEESKEQIDPRMAPLLDLLKKEKE